MTTANGNLRLSPQHGVNPSVDVCFVCQQPVGVCLLGYNGGAEAPRYMCSSREPCDQCKRHMQTGVILISVSEKLTTDQRNPWRTGGWVVIKEEALTRAFHDPQEILRMRVAFLTDEVWDRLGLPRGDITRHTTEAHDRWSDR
jgi:hypothetical protein